MIARIQMNQAASNSSSRGCKSPTYLHYGTQMLMFAYVYFHRLVFLQKNKYKGGRKASLSFYIPCVINDWIFCLIDV